MAVLIFVYVSSNAKISTIQRSNNCISAHVRHMSVLTPADLSKMKHESGAAESDVCGAEQVEKIKLT